jgi:regulator of RNase E activity RraA
MTMPTAATLTTILLKDFSLRNTAVRGVAPLDPGQAAFMGPAFTVRYLPLREDLLPAQSLSNSTAIMHQLLDRIRKGDVLVMDGRAHDDNGLIGDIIGARLHAIGVAGVVMDGRVRDGVEIARLGLAVQCRGVSPPPSFVNLMIADVQLPIACGGVTVYPGDQVVADGDGVTVVPAAMWATVGPQAIEQDRVERYIRLRVEKGEKLAGLYPPNDASKAAYKDWVARGEPVDRLT